jgi:hypothetical protein
LSTDSRRAVRFDLSASDTYDSAVNAMTAYALSLELAPLLADKAVESACGFAGGMTVAFSGVGRRFLHLVSVGRETEIILSEDRLLPESVCRPSFGDLSGKVVASVEPLGLERVILIRFEKKGTWGEKGSLTLRIDLSSVFRAAALFREGAGRALETFGAPGTRPPGSPRQLPPPKRWSLLDLPAGWDLDPAAYAPHQGPAGAEEHTRLWEEKEDLSSILVRNVGGVDPVLSKALAARFVSDPAGLSEALTEIGARLRTGGFEWKVYDFPEAGDRGICSVYPVALPFDPRPGSPVGMSAVLDARTGEKVIPVYTAWLRKAAARQRLRALKKTRRLLVNVQEDLESARRADEMRYMGNLLVTWRHRLKPGMREITVKDFNGEDEVKIQLDPALDPEGNIRALFRRAKKGDKGLEIIKARRASIRKDIEELERGIAEIAAVDDPAALAAMIIPAGGRGAGPGKAGDAEKPRFKSFRIDAAHTILVGRSDRENDELTHRYAAPSDLWFHAQGTPGSHVVLRGAGPSTPASVIEKAAETAAWFSKARGSGTVPVICAEKRYVRRPRGAKPGTAACLRSKTLFVSPRLPEADATPGRDDREREEH